MTWAIHDIQGLGSSQGPSAPDPPFTWPFKAQASGALGLDFPCQPRISKVLGKTWPSFFLYLDQEAGSGPNPGATGHHLAVYTWDFLLSVSPEVYFVELRGEGNIPGLS